MQNVIKRINPPMLADRCSDHRFRHAGHKSPASTAELTSAKHDPTRVKSKPPASLLAGSTDPKQHSWLTRSVLAVLLPPQETIPMRKGSNRLTTSLIHLTAKLDGRHSTGEQFPAGPRFGLTQPPLGENGADLSASRTSGRMTHKQHPRSLQRLTLVLDGITAGDYLTWARDPDPPELGYDLEDLTIRADPFGDRIELALVWNREPPAPQDAAIAAGLTVIPEVAELRSSSHQQT